MRETDATKETETAAAATTPTAAAAAKATTQTPPTEAEAKEEALETEGPSRCLSVSSTTADTATLSSCIGSTDCLDVTQSPTVAGAAAAAAACCAAAGVAAHAAQTAAGEPEDLINSSNTPTKKKDATLKTNNKNNNNNKGLVSQLVKKERNFRLRWPEVAAAAAGAAAPAVYGHLTNGDWGLGFCFFGALRWVIELHAADRIATHA